MTSSLDDVIDSLEAVSERHGLLSSDAAAHAGRTLLTALAHRECEGSRTAAGSILTNMGAVDARSRMFRAAVSLMGSLDETPDPSLLTVLSSHQRPLLEALNAAAANPDPDLDADGLFELIAASGVVAAAIEISEESSDASTALFFLSLVEPLVASLGSCVKGFGLPFEDTDADADEDADEDGLIDSRHVGLRLLVDCASLVLVRRLALARNPLRVEHERRRRLWHRLFPWRPRVSSPQPSSKAAAAPRTPDLLAAEDLAATASARPGTCYELGCRVLRALIAESQGREAEYPS